MRIGSWNNTARHAALLGQWLACRSRPSLRLMIAVDLLLVLRLSTLCGDCQVF